MPSNPENMVKIGSVGLSSEIYWSHWNHSLKKKEKRHHAEYTPRDRPAGKHTTMVAIDADRFRRERRREIFWIGHADELVCVIVGIDDHQRRIIDLATAT